MYEQNGVPGLNATKQHFKILDGLRGLAAVAVVIFHFMEIAIPDYSNNFIAHAFLAVDFFFCLSGFVIAYAYDQKLLKIGVWNFFKLRLIRLHPLVVIGAVIGIIAFMLDPFSDLYLQYSGNLVTMFLTACLMIPYPVVPERYFNLFHLNPPTWSLFWEYVANIFYAFILIRIRNKVLWILTIIAGAALFYEAQRSGNLSGGWGGDNIFGGFARVFYSFLAGMLVYRSKWIINSRLTFPVVGILLAVVFLVPFVKEWNPIVEPLIVIFYFPFLIALGAGARLTASSTRLCNFSGEISYPLYMVHYPFIWIFFSWVEKNKPSMSEMTPVIITGVILLTAFAYLVMILIDIPVRNRLKGLLNRSVPVKGGS